MMPNVRLREIVDRAMHDVRFALRQLRAARSFAAVAIATLAIGIGATAAVFSVVDAVVLRPLPFDHPDRVVNVHPARDGVAVPTSSNLELATWRALPGVFDGVVATTSASFTVARGDAPEVVPGLRVTAEFNRVFGMQPEIGRGFSSGDDHVGAPHVVLLSHKRWVRDFNAQRAVVGQTLMIDGEQYAIIGVMPSAIDQAGTGAELWVPLALSPTDLQEFRVRALTLSARLSPGVTITQASKAVDAAEQRLSAAYPMWGKGYTGQATLFSRDLVGNLRPRLFILLGAVAFVFLIACVNVANLLLARGTSRVREMAIRTALGAERGVLLRQMLTESAVLCAIAGAIGVLVAYGVVNTIVSASPPGVPRIETVRVDGVVLLFTFLVSAACSVIVGLIPAMRAASPALQATLREGSRGTGESKARERARSALVGAEVALAMTLLTGAALLIRTAWEIAHVDPGFESARVLTTQLLLPAARYSDFATSVRAYHTIRDEVSRTPGVQSVALTSSLPLSQGVRSGVGAEGRPMTDGERLIVGLRLVTPGYFATMKTRLRMGHDFTTSDNASAPNVAIINDALARRLWPGESALGKRIEGMDPSHQHFMTIIGVVADSRDAALDQPAQPEFYIPLDQTPAGLWAGVQGSLIVVARTAGAPEAMERPIRGAVSAVDPALPMANVATMDALVAASRAAARFNTLLLSALGAIALVLASVGVYGVIAYSVSQRTREIGLRMALGATPSAIARLVVGRALSPVGGGAMIGAILSIAATRLLREQLYGVAPGDPLTIAGIGVLLLAVSCLAATLPTRRAMKVSPSVALSGS